MKTIEIQLYKFDELSEEAKQNAINKLCDVNVDFDWWQFTYNNAKNIGLKITSFGLDRNRHANGEFLKDATYCANKIIQEHGQTCNTYQTAKDFLEESERIATNNNGDFENEQFEEFTDLENDFFTNQDIEHILYNTKLN